MVGASTIVERTRKTSNLKIEARFVNIPESPKFMGSMSNHTKLANWIVRLIFSVFLKIAITHNIDIR